MLIEAEEYLGQVVRYIHLNPVKANMVKRPQDYKWSSHRAYLTKKTDPWLERGVIMGWFKTSTAFHEFVMEGNEKTIIELYQRRRWPVILGGEEFIEQVRGKSSKLTKENIREERQFVRPSLQRVMEVVSKVWKVPVSRLLDRKRGDSNWQRKVTLWALREYADLTYADIAKVGGFVNERSVGLICQEVQSHVRKDCKLQKRLKRIEKSIS
jgi:putative transposase